MCVAVLEVDDHDMEDDGSSCYVPEDIRREICLRLPVKALLRFRSVDKRFRHLISTQQFGTDHLKTFRPKEDQLLLLHRGAPGACIACCLYLDGEVPTHVEDVPLPYVEMEDRDRVTIVDYSDGVACLIGESSCGSSSCKMVFLNPSIRKAVTVLAETTHLDISSLRLCWFGHVDDDDEDNYKLVVLPRTYKSEGEAPLKANVFSLKTRNWETLTCSLSQPQLRYRVTSSRSVYVNGACHWIFHDFDDGSALYVLSFYLGRGDHMIKKFLVPSFICGRYDSVSIHVYEGCLSLIVQRYEQYDKLEMWVMKEYGASWTRKIESTDFRSVDDVLGFTGGGDIVYSRPGHWGPGGWTNEELACYNRTSKTTRSLKESHHGALFLGRLGAYRENLVLLNQDSGFGEPS